MLRKLVFVVLVALGMPCFVFPVAAQDLAAQRVIEVPTGTPFDARITEDMSPSQLNTGDRVLMVVDKDVIVDNYVVIHAGARVVAEVAESKEKSYAGQAGKIILSFKTVTTVDGQQIAISGSRRAEGDDVMVESIGLGLVCCPLFLLMKGEEGIIKAGQVVTAYTVATTKVTIMERD
jgi:hypothetical protein